MKSFPLIAVISVISAILGAPAYAQDLKYHGSIAEAFGADVEFFAFYRSMEAYREALGQGDTTMVLSPDSEFFRFFGDITGGVAAE